MYTYLRQACFLLLFFPLLAMADTKLELRPQTTGGSYGTFTYKNVRYGVFTADPALVSLHWKNPNGTPYDSLGNLRRYLEKDGASVAFLMNAGIYSVNDTPAGLWIEHGKELMPLNTRNGKDNFHIQPNGVFFIEKGKAHIQTSAAYKIRRTTADWALQSGPMLIIDGKINPRFVKDLSSPHKRNAVCTTREGNLYFILTEFYGQDAEWPSFYRLAEALQSIGCQQALYLDGTISAWYIPKISDTFHWSHFVGIIAVTTPEKP